MRRWIALAAVIAAALWLAAGRAPRRVLRVCADPNNLPFSNARGEGFENRIAEMVAREMEAAVEYTWWAQRRGFVRNTLQAGACDVIPGVPASLEMVRATVPYYRSTYVFVSRVEDGPPVASFDSPELRRVRIGVHLAGDDYANTPPAHALARRGIVDVAGYRLTEDYRRPNPPARLIEAVMNREIDVAIAWGPLAGYFAKRSGGALRVVPVAEAADGPALPFIYDIAMGVRRGDEALQRQLDAIIARRRGEIGRILDEYGVPRLELHDAAN